jgi:hypothetical protein
MPLRPLSSTTINATPEDGTQSTAVDLVGHQAVAKLAAKRIVANAPDHGGTSAEARRRHGLIRTLAARHRREGAAEQRFARHRQAGSPRHQIHVQAADDDDLDLAHAGRTVQPVLARRPLRTSGDVQGERCFLAPAKEPP